MENMRASSNNEIEKIKLKVSREYKETLQQDLKVKGSVHNRKRHRCLISLVLKETVGIPRIKCQHLIRSKNILCKRCEWYLKQVMSRNFESEQKRFAAECQIFLNEKRCRIPNCPSIIECSKYYNAEPCPICYPECEDIFTRPGIYAFLLCFKYAEPKLIKPPKDVLKIIFSHIRLIPFIQTTKYEMSPYFDSMSDKPIKTIVHMCADEKLAKRTVFNFGNTCPNSLCIYKRKCFSCQEAVPYAFDDLKQYHCTNCRKGKEFILDVSPDYRPENVKEDDLKTHCRTCNMALDFKDWYVCKKCKMFVFCSPNCAEKCNKMKVPYIKSCAGIEYTALMKKFANKLI